MASDFPAHAAFTFLNQSRDVFVIADAGGALRYVSPSAANLFGFKNADILGKPATLFIHPGARLQPSRSGTAASPSIATTGRATCGVVPTAAAPLFAR